MTLKSRWKGKEKKLKYMDRLNSQLKSSDVDKIASISGSVQYRPLKKIGCIIQRTCQT